MHVLARVAGAQRALGEAGLDAEHVPALIVPNTLSGGIQGGETLLDAGKALPDGIFATTDAIALGLLEAFRSRGVNVPEDIALVAHDGLFASTISMPALTTITPPMIEMGRTSVDLLLRLIEAQPLPPLTLLDAQFVVRESTIGSGVRARRGFATPLSHPRAWSCWRTQMHEPEGERPGVNPPVATGSRPALDLPARSAER